MEFSTLFLSNTFNLELHGIFAPRDLFPFIWIHRPIFAFFITFTQYRLTMHPPSCQLTIEYIALLNDKILRCVIVSIAMLFLC